MSVSPCFTPLNAETQNNIQTNGRIPCTLWGFWDKDVLPPIVKRCVETWRAVHPTWEIRIVTPKNLTQYLELGKDVPERLLTHETPPKQSDMVRFALLYKYGGIYIDATTLITYPGIHWIPANHTDWFSFRGEINIIASARRGRVIGFLYPHMLKLISIPRGPERLRYVKDEFGITHNYLYTQYMIQKLIQKTNWLRSIMQKNGNINPWETMYWFWECTYQAGLKKGNAQLKKHETVIEMFTNTSPLTKSIPKKSTLHKLQGAYYTARVQTIVSGCWFEQLERLGNLPTA